MHIHTFTSSEPLAVLSGLRQQTVSVSWFLFDRATMATLFGFGQSKQQTEWTRWGAVMAYMVIGGTKLYGAAWTSKKDEFDPGVGMRVSLTRALGNLSLSKAERSVVWSAVNADPDTCALLRSHLRGRYTAAPIAPSAGEKKRREISATLIRRGNAIYRDDTIAPTRWFDPSR